MQSPSANHITDSQNWNWNSTMESRCNPIDRTQILSSRSGRRYVHSLSSIHKIFKKVEKPYFTNKQNTHLCWWQYVLWLSVFPSSTTYSWKSNKPMICDHVLEKKETIVLVLALLLHINYCSNQKFNGTYIIFIIDLIFILFFC